MPELPEVETIKNELAPYVTGRTITGVTLLWEGVVREPSPREFQTGIKGKTIARLVRRGKYLIFNLDGGAVLVIHLRMSGSLLLNPSSAELERFVRAIFDLDNGARLYFRDPRKFGRMWLVKDVNKIVGGLGPEPLEPDFTPEVLAKLLAKRTAPIKALLCDQALIAGIGNMYADEALFAAGIHPLRVGGSLTREEIERLYRAIREVLAAAIGNKGASIVNYYRPGGELGIAHFQFRVAHRRGELCPVCGTPVQRIVVRNRGTYFCPRCQR